MSGTPEQSSFQALVNSLIQILFLEMKIHPCLGHKGRRVKRYWIVLNWLLFLLGILLMLRKSKKKIGCWKQTKYIGTYNFKLTKSIYLMRIWSWLRRSPTIVSAFLRCNPLPNGSKKSIKNGHTYKKYSR